MNSTGEKCAYIYIVNLRKHAVFDERNCIVQANGKTTASLSFLNDTSTDTAIKSRINGKQRKCWMIPHPSISQVIVRRMIDIGNNKNDYKCNMVNIIEQNVQYPPHVRLCNTLNHKIIQQRKKGA